MSLTLLIVGMALATFIPRYLPIALATRVKLSATTLSALSYVPITVLTVIAFQTIFIREGEFRIAPDNPYILAALIAGIIAYLQRSFLLTLIAGVGAYVALQLT